MTALVPNRFLFDFEFPVHHRDTLPSLDGRLQGWTDVERLPRTGMLDGRQDFADLWACWNETGLALACRVRGKHRALRCEPTRYWAGDNVRLCTDMRDTRNAKRASRFCQQFYFLPTGGGARKNKPVAGVAKIKRAREDAPHVPAQRITVASVVTKTGYTLEAWIPSATLSGFDPEEHPRIGFYVLVEDAELGQQYATVGDDLSWHVDPSTWPTAVLMR